MALALLQLFDAEAAIPLVVGGLFVNHLFAKAGLFWLAGICRQGGHRDWSVLTDRSVDSLCFAIFFPPSRVCRHFPGSGLSGI